MEALIEYLAKEGRVILQAPATFSVALVLCVGVIWAAFSWAYLSRFEGQSSTLSSLEGRLKLKDDQISDYKDKLSGATPLEAKKRIEALELQVTALSPRRLTTEQKAQISNSLAGAAGSINIGSDMAVADAKPLAADLASAFQAAGWRVNLPMFMGLSDPPASGLGLRIANPSQPSQVDKRVQAALRAANLVFDVETGRLSKIQPYPGMPPEPDIEIEITNKSN